MCRAHRRLRHRRVRRLRPLGEPGQPVRGRGAGGERRPDRAVVLVHAVAYSDKAELDGRFLDTSRANFLNSLDISCYSFVSAKEAMRPRQPTPYKAERPSRRGAELTGTADLRPTVGWTWASGTPRDGMRHGRWAAAPHRGQGMDRAGCFPARRR